MIDITVESFEGEYVAKSPISHGSDEDFGMEQKFRTIEMSSEGENIEIPVVSGNSLRGILRDLLAKHLLDFLDIEVGDKLSYALYSGGTLERGKGKAKIKRRTIEKVRENLPMISLLGTALGSQLISGKLNMGMLVPISRETEPFTGVESERSIFEFLDETFYTRKDDIEGEKERDEDEQAQQMRYRVEILIPGTKFYHWMDLENSDEIEKSCLFKSFDLFSESPHIGGMKAKGHGKVGYDYSPKLGDGEKYENFLKDNESSIRGFLKELDEDLS